MYTLLEQGGPPHQPAFRIGVTVNGVEFTGEGRWVGRGLCNPQMRSMEWNTGRLVFGEYF